MGKHTSEIFDTDIYNLFNNVLNKLHISKDDIHLKMYDFTLPEIPQDEHAMLRSSEGMDIPEDIMKKVDTMQPDGLMYYKSRPVLVYQRDQYISFQRYYENKYNPYHICYCKALEDAKIKNRYESRYVLTYDTSGTFKVNISIRDYDGDEKITEQKEQGVYKKLRVCQSCLYKLNWKGFRRYTVHTDEWWLGGDKKARARIVNAFSIKEFLQNARKKMLMSTSKEVDYLETPASAIKKEYKLASTVKQELKDANNNTCECCGKIYPSRLLEIHHKNHNEGDNKRTNLMVVCKRCHNTIHEKEGGFIDQ